METINRLVNRATADGLVSVALRDPDPEIRDVSKALSYLNPSYRAASYADAERVARALLANVPSTDRAALAILTNHIQAQGK